MVGVFGFLVKSFKNDKREEEDGFKDEVVDFISFL